MNDVIWKPNVTVAALIEREGHYLLVEEETDDGLRLNQPAGHLDEGESLVDACAREALEESAWKFVPTALVGVYQWKRPQGTGQGPFPVGDNNSTPSHSPPPGGGGDQSASSTGRGQIDKSAITYLRFAFAGTLGAFDAQRKLDSGILRAVWMTVDEIRASQDRHRSPLVWHCVQDHLAGRCFPLDLIRHYDS